MRLSLTSRLTLATLTIIIIRPTTIITTVPTPWLDRRHVVFGEVVQGYDFVKHVESLGSDNGTPKRKVFISASGVIEEEGAAETENKE